jgi:hypothetical protein
MLAPSCVTQWTIGSANPRLSGPTAVMTYCMLRLKTREIFGEDILIHHVILRDGSTMHANAKIDRPKALD